MRRAGSFGVKGGAHDDLLRHLGDPDGAAGRVPRDEEPSQHLGRISRATSAPQAPGRCRTNQPLRLGYDQAVSLSCRNASAIDLISAATSSCSSGSPSIGTKCCELAPSMREKDLICANLVGGAGRLTARTLTLCDREQSLHQHGRVGPAMERVSLGVLRPLAACKKQRHPSWRLPTEAGELITRGVMSSRDRCSRDRPSSLVSPPRLATLQGRSST